MTFSLRSHPLLTDPLRATPTLQIEEHKTMNRRGGGGGYGGGGGGGGGGYGRDDRGGGGGYGRDRSRSRDR